MVKEAGATTLAGGELLLEKAAGVDVGFDCADAVIVEWDGARVHLPPRDLRVSKGVVVGSPLELCELGKERGPGSAMIEAENDVQRIGGRAAVIRVGEPVSG